MGEGRTDGFTVKAGKNLFEDIQIGGAYGVFAALGPIADVVFSSDFERGGACDGDGGNLRRLFFLGAETKNSFGEL